MMDTPGPSTAAQPGLGVVRLAVLGVFLAAYLAMRSALPGPGGTEPVEPGLDPRGFRYLKADAASGAPVRYNPCEPIHYTINPALAPPMAIDNIHTAFEATGLVSGIDFVFDGPTDEPPDPERLPYQPERYGERWAPVLIAFSNGPPDLGGPTEVNGNRRVGQGGSQYDFNDGGVPVYVTGMAVFDGTARMYPGFGDHTWGQLALHELGHVVGLAHVVDPDSIMNETMNVSRPSWGPGDRAGLLELGGSGSCVETPDPPS